LLVMLIDDIRRLVTWLILSIAYQISSSSDNVGNIDRSVFLKRTALVLGACRYWVSPLVSATGTATGCAR